MAGLSGVRRAWVPGYTWAPVGLDSHLRARRAALGSSVPTVWRSLRAWDRGQGCALTVRQMSRWPTSWAAITFARAASEALTMRK